MSDSQSLHIRLSDNKLVSLGVRDVPGSTAPRVTGVGARVAEEGQTSGWLTLVNPVPKVYPAGPPAKPYAKTHTVVQADALVFHTASGDVTYRVTRQPGKFFPDGSEAFVAGDPTAEVFFDYRLELVEG